MSFLSAIAGPLVSGVFGLFGKKKKQETTTSTVDYNKMVADASAAGFNPLTAIRNGGSAGFTTTTSPTISNNSEILANLGGVLGQALGDKLDPIQAKRRELDTLLVDTQLRQLKQGPQLYGSMHPPRLFSGTKVSQQLVPRLGVSGTKKAASVPASFIGPPSPRQFAQDNGGMDMYVPYYNRFSNSVEYGPNPDMADLEQFPMPAAITGSNTVGPMSPWIKETGNRFQRGWRRQTSRPPVTVRPASPAQTKANKDSWHGGWLPSFSFD